MTGCGRLHDWHTVWEHGYYIAKCHRCPTVDTTRTPGPCPLCRRTECPGPDTDNCWETSGRWPRKRAS